MEEDLQQSSRNVLHCEKLRNHAVSQCVNRRNILLSRISHFKYTVELANILKHRSFYFKCFLDVRGRIYYSGYGLFPQGDALSKFLLDLEGVSVSNVRHNIDLEKISDRFKGKNFFEHISLLPEIGNNVISGDVSNSGLQILSGLVGSLTGLLNTNFFFDTNKSNTKNDLYSVVLSEMKNQLKKKAPKEFLKNLTI